MTSFITDDNIESFKKAYKKAMTDKKETFIFEGKPMLTTYAYYVIEHVNSLNPKTDVQTT